MIRTLVLKSLICNAEYEIRVALPPSYDARHSKEYPSIYVLDGNLFFEMVLSIIRLLQVNRSFPTPIVIGVGYRFDDMFGIDYDKNFEEFSRRRSWDFTPIKDEAFERSLSAYFAKEEPIIKNSGGAEAFCEFLSKELIPKIEADYRAMPDRRILVGHSLGGFFTLLMIFRLPRVFDGYIAGSPAFSCCDGLAFELEKDYAKRHNSLPAKVFIGIGDQEQSLPNDPIDCSVSGLHRFAAALESRKHEGLTIIKRIFEGQDHLSVPSMVFSCGLRCILS